MSTTTRERRIVAVLASLVPSPFTFSGLSSAAMATTGNPMGDIANMPGTINVYEHTNPGGTLEYGSSNEVPVGGEALDGVSFTPHKVEGVDLVNGSAGWDVVGKITDPTKPVEPALDNQNSPTEVAIDGKKYTLKKIDEKATADETGLAQFTDVHLGLYIVVESEAFLPPGSVTITEAAPFFITLPIKDAKGAWSYTANVYPKNTVSPKPGKSAEVKNVADSMVTWTVKQTLPTFDDINRLTKFRFEDDLSGVSDTKDTLASVKVMVNGRDRTGDLNKELAGLDSKHLAITVKNPGDPPLGEGTAATYTIKASGNGQSRNSILSFINDVEVGHALAFADLGKITVEKLDATDKTSYLSDAEFRVCADEGGVEEIKDCLAVGTITTEKSLGTESPDKLKIQKYVLFETAAPAGYTFNLDTPYRVDLTTAIYNTVALAIENTKTNVPTLPLTGADGQLLMTIGGVAFIFPAGGVFLVVRKKRSEKWALECGASLMRGHELLSGLHSTIPCGGEFQEGFPVTATPTLQQPQPPEEYDQDQPQRTSS